MLSYLRDSVEGNVNDAATRQVYDCVRYIKELPEVRGEYMTVEQYLKARIDEGVRETVEEAVEESRHEMRVEGILELLEDCGEVPESVRKALSAEKSEEKLKKWHKLAARVESIDEFAEKMQQVE